MTFRKIIATTILATAIAWALVGCAAKEEAPAPVDAGKDADTAEQVGTAEQVDAAEHVAACRVAMQKLGGALKGRLQEAVAAGGLIEALEVCNVEAVPIAETISIEEGVIVGRTSLRVRNPRNAPDAWERATLEDFAARAGTVEDVGTLEAWTVTENEGEQRTFRYMRAIGTAPLCLSCHGEALTPEVTAKLAELYPADAATGFAAGDIRGAFTIVKSID